MRKLIFMLFGLALLAGALGAGFFRFAQEPRSTQWRSLTPAQPGAMRSSQQPPTTNRPSLPAAGQVRNVQPANQQLSAFQVFDTAVNVLNVVVGLIGIWLAYSGMRMQRSAAAMGQHK